MSEPAYNKTIRELLGWIATLDDVGPIELCCMWLNDFYFPGQKMPPQYPPESWARGQAQWNACFTQSELCILAEFHNIFSSKVDALPVDANWRQDTGWQAVNRAAGAAQSGWRRSERAPRSQLAAPVIHKRAALGLRPITSTESIRAAPDRGSVPACAQLHCVSLRNPRHCCESGASLPPER